MKIILFVCLLSLIACRSTGENEVAPAGDTVTSDGLNVDQVMDAWHGAAAGVDAQAYLGFLADDSVFLGTDPGERWDKAQFSSYVEHYFNDLGRGWTYQPSQRQVSYGPDGKVAWFDERLENAGYGVLRGTGVLRLLPSGWRIVHYSMTFAVPNGKVAGLVDLLGLDKKPAEEVAPETSPE